MTEKVKITWNGKQIEAVNNTKLLKMEDVEKKLKDRVITYVPNELVHSLIKESYTMYKKLNTIPKHADDQLNQTLSKYHALKMLSAPRVQTH